MENPFKLQTFFSEYIVDSGGENTVIGFFVVQVIDIV